MTHFNLSGNEDFNEDPQDDLRIENEILKLKLQAQHGATFGETDNDLPPEVENQFLQNIQRFEDAWQNARDVKVYDLIGRPQFKKVGELQPVEIEEELARIHSVLNEKNLFLDVLGKYEPQVIYKFITEELFEHETQNLQLPGWTTNFIYEEFHPNHEMDIENATDEFLHSWMERNFGPYTSSFASEFVTPEGNTIPGQRVKDKLNEILSYFQSFENVDARITEKAFEWNETEETGQGFSVGTVSFDALMENGENVHFEGTFRFNLCNKYGYWQIVYFEWPGFNWQSVSD